MCGRYKYEEEIEFLMDHPELKKIKLINNVKDVKLKKYDIAPTNNILTVLKRNNIYSLESKSWGIKFDEKSPLIFNSRIETIISKPYWKTSFTKRRIIVPMTGFYEWQKIGNTKYRKTIYLPDNKLFFVPALYQEINGKIFTSLVTTEPNDIMKPIHNRMPVILKPDEAIKIMNVEIEEALKICKPYDGKMKIIDYIEGE